MKSIPRILSSTILSVLLISMLSACNNPIGVRNSDSSSQPAAHTVQPPTVQPASPIITTLQPASHDATDLQSDPQGDELEQSLNDLTNELNATDTLDDLK